MNEPTLYRINCKVAGITTTAHLIPELIEDRVLVPVKPTHGVCVTHDHLEIEGRNFCIHGTESDIGDGVYEWDCEVVDAWIGEPT